MAFDVPTLPPDGYTPDQFQIWWQGMVSALQSQFADIEAAVAAAQAAADAALAAQTTANAVAKSDKLNISYPVPANVLSASDNGTNATITIAAHTRKYGDGTSLNVSGGSLTGNYSTEYGIYYNDATLADTTPTYSKTTNLTQAITGYTASRHGLGTITTPASGGAASVGGSTPPGTGAVTETDRDKYSTL